MFASLDHVLERLGVMLRSVPEGEEADNDLGVAGLVIQSIELEDQP